MVSKFKIGMVAAVAFLAVPSFANAGKNIFLKKLPGVEAPDTTCKPCASKGTIILSEKDLKDRIAFTYRSITGKEMPEAEAREEDAAREVKAPVKETPEQPVPRYSAEDEARATGILGQGTDVENVNGRMAEIENLLEMGNLSPEDSARLRALYKNLSRLPKQAPAQGSQAAEPLQVGIAADSAAVVNELKALAPEYDKATGQTDSYDIVMKQVKDYSGSKFIERVRSYMNTMRKLMAELGVKAAPAGSTGIKAVAPPAAADTAAQANTGTAQTDAGKCAQIIREGTGVLDAEGRMREIEELIAKGTVSSEQVIELKKVYKSLSACLGE